MTRTRRYYAENTSLRMEGFDHSLGVLASPALAEEVARRLNIEEPDDEPQADVLPMGRLL